MTFLKKDFMLVFKNNVALSVVYLFLIPVIRGIENLSTIQSAQCLEQSVTLIGIILIVPVNKWEQDTGIKELIFSKTWAYIKTVVIRLGTAFSLTIVLIVGFAVIMNTKNCSFPFANFVLGSILVSLFMGLLGLWISQISGSAVVGYLAASGYYSLCHLEVIAVGDRLYLFPMSSGILDYHITRILLVLDGILLGLCLFTVSNIINMSKN